MNRRWDDVEVGASLPPLEIPITATTLAKDVWGTRDMYPIHHDREFAQARGARDMFLNTMWYQGVAGRYVTDWAGPEAFPRRLSVAMHAHSCPGDLITVRGTVTGRRVDGDRRLVDLDIAFDNQLRTAATTAQVTVELG